ncbi:nucleoside/nucleotide kinase family protein [Rosenbergiella sp. S61]|uniref:Nucleoside/nucleotide kinase family protein n=1 Tax=Rosenbergiella gaditana TaxID=2726987 RepID=A0ABS5SX96_9GAMM|nr:nucleoside/nucleotide kinase family protein [Rosenbergiella gaditana]MBT0724696.1 nucleoside/nucleotide kinase family protein [Rosenbergiella gaditana]
MIDSSALQQLHEWIEGDNRYVLGIIGLPGAGKSTLTDWLKEQFTEKLVVIPMDGFHLANNQLKALGRLQRKGAPDTFDVRGYHALLHRVKQGYHRETVYAPCFHREIEESIAGEIAIPADVRLIITEGNYLLSEEAGWADTPSFLDQTWFIHVDETQRLTQLKRRHREFGRSEQEAEQWIATTDQPNAELIQLTAYRADKQIFIKQ